MSWSSLLTCGSITVDGINCFSSGWRWHDWFVPGTANYIPCGGLSENLNPGYLVIKCTVDSMDETYYQDRISLSGLYIDVPDTTTDIQSVYYICEDPPDFSLSGDVDITPDNYVTYGRLSMGVSAAESYWETISETKYYNPNYSATFRPSVGKTYYMYIHLYLGSYQHDIHLAITSNNSLYAKLVGCSVKWLNIRTLTDVSSCGAYSGPTARINQGGARSSSSGVWASISADGPFESVGMISVGSMYADVVLPAAGTGSTDVTYYVAISDEHSSIALDAPPPSTTTITFSRYRANIYVPAASTYNTVSGSSGSFERSITAQTSHISGLEASEYTLKVEGVTVEPLSIATLYRLDWAASGPAIDGNVIYPLYTFTRNVTIHVEQDLIYTAKAVTTIYGEDVLAPYSDIEEPPHLCNFEPRYVWQYWIDTTGANRKTYTTVLSAVQSDKWELWAYYKYQRDITIYPQGGHLVDIDTGELNSRDEVNVLYPAIRVCIGGLYQDDLHNLSIPSMEPYDYQRDNATWIGYGDSPSVTTPITWAEVWAQNLTEVYVQWKLDTNVFYGVDGTWIPCVVYSSSTNTYKTCVVKFGAAGSWKFP